MERLNHSVNWVEIPVSNFARARKFYSTIFNHDIPDAIVGGVRMGFLPTDAMGFAICQGDHYVPSEWGALVYLNGGDDLNAILGRIEEAGGTIMQPKKRISEERGYVAIFRDIEGNRIALHSRF